jgi:toxin-antitoxin system PIN domain toxin
VNVLVALAWPNHVHHEAAHRWFAARQRAKQRWATCPITQSGFVRVSSNARVVPQARSPIEAIQLLARMLALPGHEFWSDDVSIVSSSHVAREKLVGHGQVTDAHLLALAIAHRGVLVTFDGGVAEIVPDSTSAAKALCVIVP